MSFYERRCAWVRLTPERQREVAETAARIGIRAAAEEHTVSETAIRRACAMTAILPRDMRMLTTRDAKIRQARALLRSMGLKPQDLIDTQ